MTHAERQGTFNWRQFFFYAVEIVYALIAGLSEAYIYQLYQADGWQSIAEAVARATITQVVLILFAVATIEASRAVGGGWRGFTLVGLLNIILIPFSLVAFWFMREAAILFAHTGALGPLNAAPLVLPWGWSIHSQDVDVNLIASLPFFQIAMTWIAPLVVRRHAPETTEERAAREAAETARALHDAELRTIKTAGWRQMGLALTGKVDPLHRAQSGSTSDSNTEGATTPNPGGGDGPAGAGLGTQSGRGSGGKLHALRLAPARPDALKGRITARQLVKWVATTLGREIGERDALMLLHSIPDSGRTHGITGRAISAPKAVALQRARVKWDTTPDQWVAGD